MKYKYTVQTKDGKRETGEMEGGSEVAVGHNLRAQNLMPLEIKAVSSGASGSFLEKLSRVKLAEKIVFIQDLGVMLKSGIPVVRSLKILSRQTSNKKFAKVLNTLTQDVENGKSLHEAMAQFPDIFSNIFVSMIRVGELSGNLDQSLEYLRIQLERESDLRSHVRGAMLYPAVILFAMLLIGIIMSMFVLPKLTTVFKEFNTTLPLMTRVIIGFSDFMAANSVLVIIGLVLFVAAVGWALRTKPGKQLIAFVGVWMPFINPVVKKINLARFARVLSSLLKSGIPIVEGLKVSGESMGNFYYRDVILESSEKIREGKELTATLTKYERLFPFIMVQMLEVGQETGSLEAILEQIAQHYEAEVDATLKNFSSIIEPMLLLVIGGVVGVVAYAMIVPIYNISTNIQ